MGKASAVGKQDQFFAVFIRPVFLVFNEYAVAGGGVIDENVGVEMIQPKTLAEGGL